LLPVVNFIHIPIIPFFILGILNFRHFSDPYRSCFLFRHLGILILGIFTDGMPASSPTGPFPMAFDAETHLEIDREEPVQRLYPP
jgi:hypothetical protein